MSDLGQPHGQQKRVISDDVIIALGAHDNMEPIRHWLNREAAQHMAFHESQIQYWQNILQAIENSEDTTKPDSSIETRADSKLAMISLSDDPKNSSADIPTLKLSSIAKKRPRAAVTGAPPVLDSYTDE